MADGCIVHESCDTYRLSIILAQKDKNHLEKFRTCINALDTPIVDNESTLKVTDKTYYNSRIRINNSYMCKALMNLNVLPNKSGNEKTPNIEPRFYPSFIRGYFDGDGCFTFKYDHRNLSWECNIVIVGGFEILNFISETIYEYLKIYSEIHQDGSIYRIGIGGVNQVEDIMDWLYSYEGPVLERKFYKYMEWHKTKNYE
jgi:hypothetical protein